MSSVYKFPEEERGLARSILEYLRDIGIVSGIVILLLRTLLVDVVHIGLGVTHARKHK